MNQVTDKAKCAGSLGLVPGIGSILLAQNESFVSFIYLSSEKRGRDPCGPRVCIRNQGQIVVSLKEVQSKMKTA